MRMRFPALLLPLAAITGCTVYQVEERIPGVDPVSVDAVIAMARAQVNDWHIVGEIRANGVLRAPGTDDLIALKQAGASDAAVRAMIEAPVRTPRAPEVIRRTYYDTRPAEGAILLGLGAAAAWTFGHNHHWHHGHHSHYHGCGHW